MKIRQNTNTKFKVCSGIGTATCRTDPNLLPCEQNHFYMWRACLFPCTMAQTCHILNKTFKQRTS